MNTNNERVAFIENSIKNSLPTLKKNKFSLSDTERISLIIDNSTEVIPVFKIFEIIIKWAFDKREYLIFQRKSTLLLHEKNSTYQEIGKEIKLSGERVRQLLKKIEKSIKTRMKKFITQNPEILQASIYHKKNWSNLIILNNSVVGSINEIEKTNFSINFVEYFFSICFENHIIINKYCNLKNIYFINNKLLNEYDSVKSFFKFYNDIHKRTLILNNSNSTLKIIFETVINEEENK